MTGYFHNTAYNNFGQMLSLNNQKGANWIWYLGGALTGLYGYQTSLSSNAKWLNNEWVF